MSDLSGKIAVVTGAARGIGAAVVKRMLEDNVKGLALIGAHIDTLEATARKYDPELKKSAVYQCDVSKRDQVHETALKILEHFGTVDILINNAGIIRDKMFHKMEQTSWDEVMNTNLNSMAYFCWEFIPLMREKNYGRIVNMTSVSAYGSVGQTNYSASKAGIIGFTKSLAKESASKNICINCIAPGYIETDMYQKIPEEVLKQYFESIPMKRLGRPDEIASVASFLSGNDTSFMTGQVLIVSGGTQT